MLHHRRQQPSHSDESVLQALSERAKHEVGRNPSPDSAQSRHGVDKENEKQVGKVNIGAGGAKGWIWWGKPLWHDLGYVAVGCTFEIHPWCRINIGIRHWSSCLLQLSSGFLPCTRAAFLLWGMTMIHCSTGLPGVIAGFSSDDGSVPIVDVFFWTPQGVSFVNNGADNGQ